MKKIVVLVVCVVLLMLGIHRFLPGLEQKLPELLQVRDWDSKDAYDINAEDWFSEDVPELNGSQEDTLLSAGEVSNLRIRAAGCKLEIQMTQESEFYYSFENMKRVQAYQTEDDLILNVMRDTQLNEGESKSVLNLFIPADTYFSEVYIELGAGSLNMEGLQAQCVELSVEAGKLTATSLETNTLTASVGAGMIALKEVSFIEGDLSVGAGSISVEGSIAGDVKAKCAMGNLEMYLLESEQDFNYELQCVAGTIQIEDQKFSHVNEKKSRDFGAEKTMELDCAVGNMRIMFAKTRDLN